jgi:WD40 repeat protein
MKKHIHILAAALAASLMSCGDDGPTVAATGVALDRTELVLGVGQGGSLVAAVQPPDASNKSVAWSSNETAVATVSNGTVRALSLGAATITATALDGGWTASCNVTVRPDVYVAGDTGNYPYERATLWKNGAAQSLGSGAITPYYSSHAYSVFVRASGVAYVAGRDDVRATLWEGGAVQRLSSSTGLTSGANSVQVSGNDVYVAGYIANWAILWKNNVYQRLGEASGNNCAHSVFVSGGDVYAAGYARDSATGIDPCATLWKNGAAQLMSGHKSQAKSVFVSDGDVYVAGHDNGRATLWKNGAAQALGAGESEANSVLVSGGDVYIAGSDSGRATLWKNGAAQTLSSHWSEAHSVCVFGDDVYIAGAESGCATLWKNGVPQHLGSVPSVARSVFVK